MIALVLGASGTTGKELTEQLIADSHFHKIKILGRQSVDLQSEKLEEYIVSDLTSVTSEHSAFEVDIVFCCLGSTLKKAGSREAFRSFEYETIFYLAKLANKRKVEKFILISSSGADQHSCFFYCRVKGELELAIQNLNFRNLVILRPALLISQRKEFRLAEQMAVHFISYLSFFLPNKLAKRLGTRVPCLAKRMIELAEQKTPPLLIVEPSRI